MAENYVRADALASGDVVVVQGFGYGDAPEVATVSGVERLADGTVLVSWADAGGRISAESYRYERLGSIVTGEAHRIGWGVDMRVCYCTDGSHADARPFRA